MKKFILAIALMIASVTFVTTQAQHISVSININSQPAWGPIGYDYVNYYYIPDINVYYNVPMSLFYYWDRGRWISARYLPYAYRHYDLYGMYKVVLNLNDPWHYNRHHIHDYARYKGVRTQHVIYYTDDRRYNQSRNNTVSWYKGSSHSTPSKRYDNNYSRSATRDNGSYNQNRNAAAGNNRNATRVENGNRSYNNNRNASVTRNTNSNQDRTVRSNNQRNTTGERRNDSNRAVGTSRSSNSNSQAQLTSSAKSETRSATTRSNSQRSSSRSQSDRTSNTRSNR